MSPKSVPLQAICLLTSSATLKDIKAEMLLFFVRNFLFEYLSQDESNSIHLVEPNNSEDLKKELQIKQLSYNIFAYLNTNVLSNEKINNVFNPIIKNEHTTHHAKQNEPIWFYYSSLLRITKEIMNDIDAYIPEIVAFEMLRIFLEEDGKQIPKHKFFNDINLDVVFTYYDEKNIELKRQINPNERLWNINTPISEAYKLATKIMARYKRANYKININRISKSRKK